MTITTALHRLRNPKPTDQVRVSFTGTPAAVLDLARALATVATVTEMRHHVQGDATIRLDATCHRPDHVHASRTRRRLSRGDVQ